MGNIGAKIISSVCLKAAWGSCSVMGKSVGVDTQAAESPYAVWGTALISPASWEYHVKGPYTGPVIYIGTASVFCFPR